MMMKLLCCSLFTAVAGAATVRFDAPQFMGLGERPDSYVGLDSASGERVIGQQLSPISYRGGAWVREPHPLPKGVVLPSQCGYPCRSVQTMPDTFAPVFDWKTSNSSAKSFIEDDCQDPHRTYGGPSAAPCGARAPQLPGPSTWSVAADGALTSKLIEPRPALRSFSGLPEPVIAFSCCGPTAEKYAFRTGGGASVKINASYYLQTVMFRFINGRKEYNHTHIPTSVVVYSSTDLLKWEYLSQLANSDDYPESEEGPNGARLHPMYLCVG